MRENAGDPKNFYSFIQMIDDYVITDNFLAEIKKKIIKNYTGLGDIIDIKAEPNKDLKIIGFKSNEIKIEVSRIIEKAKSYKIPEYWEDTVELLTSDNQVMVKDLCKATNEWNKLEANFKRTIPEA